ncbi:MAG: efflux RND transporter periplasmic adaptor subunit [Chitinophagaceae bacterium]|nr:MAG: efflux RND transporter periplasmic adaptor subunit [Chitinophagaceae bacterium]
MQKILTITLSVTLALLITACGSSGKDQKGDLGDKKAELEKLKKEQQDVSSKILKLEEEIAKLDSTAGVKAKLVALSTVGADTFTHFIDLQGKVEAQNIAFAAPRGQGGVVRAVYVKQGDVVRKGQVLLKVDDAVQRQQVVAAEQQISGIASQLEQAKSIYQRQQNLWKENIGTEVQVLNAKTNVDALQSQLNAAKANVDLAREQLNFTSVTAEISGTVNTVNIRAGESFTAGSQQIQIVNTGDLKVLVQVPENYLDRISVGTNLRVTLPEANNKVINTKVTVASKLIDPITRAFYIEGRLQQDKDLRPNQIAIVQIQDYKAPNAITIPVNTLQNDEKGKFVLVAASENGKLIARKKAIIVGQLYGEKLEVKSGLQAGDKIISEGFQGLYDGQLITTGN